MKRKRGKRNNPRRKKLHRNPSSVFAFILIAISGFLFPLFGFSIFGESFSDKSGVMMNLVIDFFSGKLPLGEAYGIIITAMMVIYLFILIFYLLNGLGVIYNRYGRRASILSIIYLFLGLFAVVFINREISIPFLGNTLGAVTLGLGTYFVTLVGILYLFFVRQINRNVRF